ELAKQAELEKTQAQTGEAKAQTAKIESETNPNNPTSPNVRKAKYEGILGKIQQGGISAVPAEDLQFAREYELGQSKTTTQSDTLGVTSTSTSRPSGLSAAMGGKGVPRPAAPGGTPGSAAAPAANKEEAIVDMIGQYKMNPQMVQRMLFKHPEVIS